MNLINLIDRLLGQGRKLFTRGQHREARSNLERLLALPDGDARFREEAHLLLAEIHLDAEEYRKARRHLAAVIAHNPNRAETYFQFGTAHELDPKGDPKLARKAFRKALRLNRQEPYYWLGYAQVELRLGRNRSAIRAFQKAAKLGDYDVDLLDEVIEGLLCLNRIERAERLLVHARFRMGRRPALEQLWQKFQFLRARQRQVRERNSNNHTTDDRVLLPFVAAESVSESTTTPEPCILRHDRFSKATPHSTRTNRIDPRRPS